jgi:hypothetical protein
MISFHFGYGMLVSGSLVGEINVDSSHNDVGNPKVVFLAFFVSQKVSSFEWSPS